MTNSPILREIGYNKGSYALKGNHYVSTVDGLYMIGKNALQKNGIKVIANSNLKEFMKPGLNPISDMYYKGSNWFIKNPSTIPDFVESYLPGIPNYSGYGYAGAGISVIYGHDKLNQDIKDFANWLKSND